MVIRQEKIDHLRSDIQARLKDHGSGWIPTHSRLIGIPHPMPSEAFSSWFWRITAQQRTFSKHLMSSLRLNISPEWVDAGRNSIDVAHMTVMTMVPIEKIARFRWATQSLLSKPAFDCLVFDSQSQQPIYRYCEKCLKEDLIPYIRLREFKFEVQL
jgi:hypothetical protein